MALTRIKTNQITDLNVTTAKLANQSVTAGKLANNITYGSDFTVSGNLTVSGTTTSVSTTNTRVEDAVLALSAEATGSASVDAGILINRGSDDNYAILWDESTDKFVFANVGSETGDTNGNISLGAAAPVTVGALVSSTFNPSGVVTISDNTAATNATSGALIVTGGVGVTGAVHSTAGFTGDLTGNADTATALATARAFSITGGGITASAVNFDGTGAVTLSASVDDDSIALGTKTTGNYVQSLADAGNSFFTITNGTAEGGAATIDLVAGSVTLGTHTSGNYTATITGGNGIASTGATSGEGVAHSLSVDLGDANIFASDGTVSRAIVMDGSGNFSAGTITAAIDGIVGGNTPAAVTGTVITANTSATLATAKVSDLTSGRVVLAGTAGELEDNGNLTFNGSTLAVTGAATVSTTLDVSGKTSLDGAVDLGDGSGDAIAILGTATFTPSADFDGGFTVAGSQTIDMGANAVTNVADPSNAQDASTKAYVDGAISAAGTLTVGADSGSADGVVVGTDTLTFAGTSGEIETAVTNNQIQIGLPNDVTIGGDAVVTGNLTVNGTTTTLSTTNSVVEDSLIEINTGASSNANDLGFIMERGSTGDNAAIIWDETEDRFMMGTTTATGSATGNLTVALGTLNANLVGAVTGNADTATTLANARAIALAGDVVGTANFDGSGDISITATIQADSVALGTDTTGNYVQSIADAGDSQITVTNGAAEGGAVTLAIANNAVALSTHTTGNYVQSIADAGSSRITVTNGTAEGGAVTLDIADDAVALGTKTTGNYVLSLADAGNSRFTITNGVAEGGAATIDLANDAVTLGTHTTGNYVANVTGGNGIAVTGSAGEGWAPAVAVDLTDTNIFASDGTASRAVVLDSNGDFTAGNITATDIDGILGSNTAAAASVTTLGTTGEATLASAIVSDLTDNRITIAGTAGALEDDANFTFDGTTFTVGGSDSSVFTATTAGVIGASGAATIAGLANLNGGIAVDSDKFTVSAAGAGVITTLAVGGALQAGSALTVASTGSIMLAKGTTAQRPTGATGMFRYNTTGNNLEYYDNTGWKSLSSDFTVATSQTFNGDDSTTDFTLSALTGTDTYSSAGVLVMLNGVVQEPTTVYGMNADGVTLEFTTAPATGDLIEVRKFTTSASITSMSDTDGNTQIQVEEGSNDNTIRFDTDGTERMTIGATGNVDINGNLNVDGNFTLGGNITLGDASSDVITINADFAGNLIPDADGTRTLGDASNKYASAFANDFITGPQGDVRFNDADSSNYVALQAPSTVSSNLTFTLPATDGTAGQAMVTDASGNLSFAAAGATISSDTSTNTNFQMYFSNATSGALTAVKQDSGLTYNPSTGTLTSAVFSGTATAAQYADLAEMYAADMAIEPGTVVHFGGEGKVAPCNMENCRSVAGIVSTDPAHLMNADQEGVALALAGRVPCKVTGPVAAGDLMVSAGNGMAMANNDAKMGTVIGKAIEAHEGGEGVIEVLALMM